MLIGSVVTVPVAGSKENRVPSPTELAEELCEEKSDKTVGFLTQLTIKQVAELEEELSICEPGSQVIKRIEHILEKQKRIDCLLQRAKNYKNDLSSLGEKHRKENEWPTENQCPSCKDFWRIIDIMISGDFVYSKKKADFVIHNLEERLSSEERQLKDYFQKVCRKLEEIKMFNIDKTMKDDFLYFTWTETYLTMKAFHAFSVDIVSDELLCK